MWILHSLKKKWKNNQFPVNFPLSGCAVTEVIRGQYVSLSQKQKCVFWVIAVLETSTSCRKMFATVYIFSKSLPNLFFSLNSLKSKWIGWLTIRFIDNCHIQYLSYHRIIQRNLKFRNIQKTSSVVEPLQKILNSYSGDLEYYMLSV